MISTVIPTYNRTALLMERAIPSVLAQAGTWECIVVGDGTEQATADAMADLCGRDRRFRFWNLPHADYPEDPRSCWAVGGMDAFNFGLGKARGTWISYLADDDAYRPDHHATLLAASQGVDLVYGQSEGHLPLGIAIYGLRWPPHPYDICQGSYILRRSLNHRADRACLQFPRSWDADWWERLFDAGVTARMADGIVHIYYADPGNLALPAFDA